MKRFAIPVLLVGFLLAASLAPAQEAGPWEGWSVEDEGFFIPVIQRNGEPMPWRQVLERPAANIVWAEFDGERLIFQIQGQRDQWNQWGINVDPDQNGVGDYWIFIEPQQVILTDGNLRPIGEAWYEMVDELTFMVPLLEILEGNGLGWEEPAILIVSFDRSVSQLQTMFDYQIGEPIEMVALNTPAQAVLLEGYQSQQQQQQQGLKDKYCPPRRRLPDRDVDGDGCDDCYFWENTREYRRGDSYLKIELWCLCHSTFGKLVTHGDGTRGWIGKCPYGGGQNRQEVVDLNNDGMPDIIRRVIVDGGSDDDGDGKQDAMVYEYNVNTRLHTSTHYEDWMSVPGHSKSQYGPYPDVYSIPIW